MGKDILSALLRACQIIYERLYNANPRSALIEISTDQVLRFLSEKDKIDPDIGVYRELIVSISKLRVKEVSPIYIERFCVAKIADHLLTVYPMNIGEAYAVSYVLLNKMVDMHLLHFKLGASGLLAPTMINGTRVEDVEAISQFIIKSLSDAEFIRITDNRFVVAGVAIAEKR